MAVRLGSKFGVSGDVADYGNRKFGRVFVGVVMGWSRFIKCGFANTVASGDSSATMHQILVAILMSEVGHQRQRGCCLGDDILITLVEERDERPGGAGLAITELGKGCEGGVIGSDQIVGWK